MGTVGPKEFITPLKADTTLEIKTEKRDRIGDLFGTLKKGVTRALIGETRRASIITSGASVRSFTDPQRCSEEILRLVSKDEALNIINHLEQKPNNLLRGDRLESLKDILKNNPDNKIPRIAQNSSTFLSLQKENSEETEKKVRALLVGLLERPPVELKTENGTITQTQGYTPSAEIQKYKEPEFNELANQRTLIHTDKEGKKELLCVTSSRSQTANQLYQKSQLAIEVSVDAGLIQPGEEIKTASISLMDYSLKKSVGTTVVSSLKGLAVESERNFLDEKKATTQARNAEGPITHEYNGNTYYEGKSYVYNSVFSAEARSAQNIEEAQKANLENHTDLFDDYLSQTAKSLPMYSDELTKLRRQLLANQSVQTCTKTIDDMIINYKPLLVDPVVNTLKIHLEAIRLLITGTDSNLNKLSSKDLAKESLKEFMATTLLSRGAGYVISLECKSGNDRTVVAISLVTAQYEFTKKHGYPPSNFDEGTPEFQEFQELFVKAFIAFAPDNLKYSRGMDEKGIPDVKVKKSPVFNYLVPKGSDARKEISKVVHIV